MDLIRLVTEQKNNFGPDFGELGDGLFNFNKILQLTNYNFEEV